MKSAAENYVQLCEESSQIPDVFDFLAKFEGLETRKKLDVLLVDQFYRWKHQQAIPVEHYIQRLSELTDLDSIPLMVEEFGQLEERGIAPAASEFVQRYNELSPQAFLLLCEELDVRTSHADCGSVVVAGTNDRRPETRQIGRYEVVCMIGKGAFGEVFLGRDPTLDRSVAIKVPNRERIEMGGGVEALLSEARVVAKIDHPNIVPVYDFGTTSDGGCYIVSKYVRGKELRSELLKPISFFEAAKIVAAVARALHAAHQQGVIHRDVKPANIMLDSTGQPHLLDFGLALRTPEAGVENALIGTPAYMSPEQSGCDGQSVDGRSDVYSLGIVFYEMLARRRPFQGNSEAEHLQHSKSTEVQPPRQLVDSIPKKLEQICLNALSYKMVERYSTAGDFADEIEQWIDESSASSLVQPTGPHDLPDGRSDSSIRWMGYSQLPEGPSIAVLPFTNLTKDSDENGIAIGLTEEIITQLTRFPDLFILGCNATAGFQADAVDVREIGRQLGVNYLLTGSVRRSSDQLRVAAQLIDTNSLANVWANSFRGNLSVQDVFDIEDEIAQQVSVSLGLHDGAIAQARFALQKDTAADISAYDSVTRFYQYRRSHEPWQHHAQVRQDLETTVERNPGYFTALGALSLIYLDSYLFHFSPTESSEELLAKAAQAARQAVEGAPQNAIALTALFRAEFHGGRFAEFEDVVERAIIANPNDTDMLLQASFSFGFLGKMKRAVPLTRKAISLNPNPPAWYYTVEYWASLLAGDYEQAYVFACRMGSVVYWGAASRACCLGHLGRADEAQAEFAQMMEVNPDFMKQFEWDMKANHVCDALLQASIEGLSKAGLM